MAVIAVFGNSSCQEGSFEYETAELLGRKLAHEGFDLITGGYAGVMEAALKGADSYSTRKIGVVLKDETKNKVNSFVNEIIKVDSYLDRLKKLLDEADIYIILPGGSGTLLEFAAAWALIERDYCKNKLIICLGEQWAEVMQTVGFYSEKALDSFKHISTAANVSEVLETIKNFKI